MPETPAIRELRREELERLWEIDRSERIEGLYRLEGDALVLRPGPIEVPGWPPGERERYEPLLLDCFDSGGSCWGAWAGDLLVGGAVLGGRFLGSGGDRLQLAFLHVGRPGRGSGLGRALFETAAGRARERGAQRLYVSSTPSRGSVDFYVRRGCRPVGEPDPELFALEPEDIHLELDLGPRPQEETE